MLEFILTTKLLLGFWRCKLKVKITQSFPTLCDRIDYTAQGILRPEYWRGWPFPSPGDLPSREIEPMSPALQAIHQLSH